MTRTLIEVSVPRHVLENRKGTEAIKEEIIKELNSSKRSFITCESIVCKNYPWISAHISSDDDASEFEFVAADAEFRMFALWEEDAEPVEVSMEDGMRWFGTMRLMPHTEYHDIWESLVFEPSLVRNVLQICQTGLTASMNVVDRSNVSKWNRCSWVRRSRRKSTRFRKILLLYGPCGSGKSSLARAVSQRLSIQFQEKYRRIVLFEIYIGSLVSRCTSVSAKFVKALFDSAVRKELEQGSMALVIINDMDCLIERREFIIKSNGTETRRIFDYFIRQLDVLRQFENFFVIGTSNFPRKMNWAIGAEPNAMIHVHNPSLRSIRVILMTAFRELVRVEIVIGSCANLEDLDEFKELCENCVGLNGRLVRNLATRALERFPSSRWSVEGFAKAMSNVIKLKHNRDVGDY